MDDLLLYGQKVTIKQGFYQGQEGKIEGVAALDETHVEQDRQTIGYKIKLEDGHITELVHEYHIEPKRKTPPKAKVLDLKK